MKSTSVEKEITIREFTADLMARIDESKGIDCCKEEIKKLARLAREHMPDEKIVVTWKDRH
jgi:hypothetical protein